MPGVTLTEKVAQQSQYWASENPAAATQWMQSLPEGAAKDRVSVRFSQKIAQNDPQAAFDIASGIGEFYQRTEAQKNAAEAMFSKDPAAATQWMQSLPEGRTKDLAASGIRVVSVKIQQKARVKDEERKGIVVDSGGELGG